MMWKSGSELAAENQVDEGTIRDIVARGHVRPEGGGQGRAWRFDETQSALVGKLVRLRRARFSYSEIEGMLGIVKEDENVNRKGSVERGTANLSCGEEGIMGREVSEAAVFSGYAPCLRVRRIDPATGQVRWNLRHNVEAAWVEFLSWSGVPVHPRPEPAGEWSEEYFGIGGRHDIRVLALRYGLSDPAIPAAELDLVDRSASPGGKRPRPEGGTGDRQTDVMIEGVDAEAKKLIEASGGKLTMVQARSEYFRRVPEAYESYRQATTIHRGGAA